MQGSTWDEEYATLTGSVHGSGRRVYAVRAEIRPRPDGRARIVATWCSCPVGHACKHAVALLLARAAAPPRPPGSADRHDGARSGTGPVAEWRRVLAPVLQPAAEHAPGGLGLQLELQDEKAPTRVGRPFRLVARPVLHSGDGRWLRSGVGWRDLGYGAGYRFDRRQVTALQDLLAQLQDHSGYGYYQSSYPTWLPLDDARGQGLWAALSDLARVGVPVVQQATGDGSPLGGTEHAEVSVELLGAPDGLVLRADLVVDGRPLDASRYALIGADEATGVYWWADGSDRLPVRSRAVRLAPLRRPAEDAVVALLRRGAALRVPAADVDQFLHTAYPALAARVAVSTPDGSVRLPDPPRPRLHLVVRVQPGHVLDLRWGWAYRGESGALVGTTPLHPTAADAPAHPWRRPALESGIVADVRAAVAEAAGRTGAPGEPDLLALEQVTAWDAVWFASDALPVLRQRDDVEVEVEGELPDYREAEQPVDVVVRTGDPDEGDPTGSDHGAGRDWFDLDLAVSVESRPVPLPTLLAAWAAGKDRLLLDDGLWVRIDSPALGALRSLVEEARALADAPRGPLRISRFQAGLWDELEELGVVVAQSAAWRDAVERLSSLAAPVDDVGTPAALHADLRPYQRSGYEWLRRLRSAGLGGVLADDMGLGKTMQVLAFAAWLDESGTGDGRPLLVVAPTSVVGNWAHEAQRFVPGLTTRVVERTAAKRGVPLAELAAGAHVLVTSYTLFRLEFDDYAALDWSGLVLDEAQLVKNHQSKAYSCARRLDVPVKIALTGTPIENSVLELWALLGIVAPGLFPSLRAFTDHYRHPIERDGDAERLALLRRRVRPLLLRRTKEQVAEDLPPRMEHLVDVELAARHRAVYDRYLNRERQKVLGLLDDFEGNRFEIFRSLTLLRRLALDPSLVDPGLTGTPATKLDLLDTMLEEIAADGHRVLVFSQFTGVLGRVRDRLAAAGTDHCYLDGSTTDRSAVIRRFRTGQAPVFLISLRAGGFGLTLTEADYVIVLDPWWNPAVEAQAVDRAHRIGQTRTVMVYRLVATGTIEAKVMALKEEKTRLFDAVLGGGDLADARLTAADVRELIG